MAKNSREEVFEQKLWDVYRTKGVKTFLHVCSEVLKLHDSDNFEKKKKANGEVCEVVLNVLTHHYLAVKKQPGACFHSMILKDKKNLSSPFRTELDFTLMTPGFCVTGECKSFVGDIVVTGNCTLVRGNLVANVERQSTLHSSVLREYLREYVCAESTLGVPILGAFCFIYSNGTLTDKRAMSPRVKLPIVTVGNLFRYYDNLYKEYYRRSYNYEQACSEFRRYVNNPVLEREHQQYLGY